MQAVRGMSQNAFVAALRDALAGGLVAAALALPLLGFRLVDTAQGVSLQPRLMWIVYAALFVFVGRLAISLLGLGARLRPASTSPLHLFATSQSQLREWSLWALGGLALVLPLLPFADRNVIDLATLVLIYVMLGTGLNIVVGLAGLLDLGYVAFYAVGAYSYALLNLYFGLSFWICLPLAGVLAAMAGVLLGFPVLRLRGDYLAIVTLGFGEIVRQILINWNSVTGGANGLTGIGRPSFFGLEFAASSQGGTTFAEFFGLAYSPIHRVIFFYYLILALAIVTMLFVERIRRQPLGRAWEALREDDVACRSLGINPTTIKLSAFALGATFAGFAGSFFATRQGFISPESFTFIESAIVLAIVVLGGMGTQIGIVVAAIFLIGLPEWFREFDQFRMLTFGAAMVLVMLWRPQGLFATRTPSMRLGTGHP
jgi:branched-chain amino acid transport system permease protein